MRIYLIGYMGSGKSSMGKKLAARLGYSFLDLDSLIEEEQKQSVSDIFAEKGENAFRSFERLALHQTFEMENIVVSTGGGTPVFFDNMSLMNEKGLCIYLKSDSDVLVNRLLPNQHLRPLIAKLSKEELSVFINEQIKKRSPFYEKAKMHIEARDLTPAILHVQVMRWFENQQKV
ncbi:MAG: shikimate kinase [Bacteroidales bacterium]|jgi:shikimate kinase|nr:shikimate kinase [Bacteroidales bacterium]